MCYNGITKQQYRWYHTSELRALFYRWLLVSWKWQQHTQRAVEGGWLQRGSFLWQHSLLSGNVVVLPFTGLFFAVHFNILLLENIKRECVREGRLPTIWVHSTCREVHCPALANTIYIYNNLQVKMFTTTMIHSKRIYPPKIHTSLLMLLLYLLCISAIFHVFF